MVKSPQHHRERCEAEVRLGLTTSRREEEQIHRVAVGGARIGEAREIQQHEGELEGAPARRLDAEALLERARHGAVRHAEGIERVGVASELRDAALNPLGSDAGQAQKLLCGLAPGPRERAEPRALAVDPGAVRRDEGLELRLCGGAIGERAEGLHRELDVGNIDRRGLLDPGLRNPGGAEHPAGAVDDLPIRRDGVARRVLRRVGVVEVGHLLVPVGRERPAQIRPRHEGRISPHLDLRLEGVPDVRVPFVGRPAVDEEDRDRARALRDAIGEIFRDDLSFDEVQLEPVRVGDRANGILLRSGERERDGRLARRALPDRERRLAVLSRDFDRRVVSPTHRHRHGARRPCDQEAQAHR